MLEVFILSTLVSIFFIPFGIFFANNNVSNLYSYSKELIFGSIFLSFLALLINFFFPLNVYINSLILIISLFILIKYKKNYINLNFLKFIIF